MGTGAVSSGHPSSAGSSSKWDKVASFILRSKDGSVGQCVIAESSTQDMHILITNHHILSSEEDIGHCTLDTGDGIALQIKAAQKTALDERVFYSCCGPGSIWAGPPPIHVPLEGNKKAGYCPREEDWSAVILDEDFVNSTLKRIFKGSFPPIKSVNHVGGINAKIVKRLKKYAIESNTDVIIEEPPSLQGTSCVRDEVSVYKSWCVLRYLCSEASKNVGEGCYGAPILSMDGSLLGLHCSSPETVDIVKTIVCAMSAVPEETFDPAVRPDPEDGDLITLADTKSIGRCVQARSSDSLVMGDLESGFGCHTGVSINCIICSLCCGGLKIECSLLSMLSLIKDMMQYSSEIKNAVPSAVMDRMAGLIELEQVSSGREGRMEHLERYLQMLEFILFELHATLSKFRLEILPQDSLSRIKLLKTLFSLFESFTAAEVCEGIGIMKPHEQTSLKNSIDRVCRKVRKNLLKKTRKPFHINKAIFELTASLLKFNCVYNKDAGPSCCLLDVSLNMLESMIQASYGEGCPNSVVQECYMAYIKVLNGVHQIEEEKRLERTKCEGEEKLEKAKQNSRQLKCEKLEGEQRAKQEIEQLRDDMTRKETEWKVRLEVAEQEIKHLKDDVAKTKLEGEQRLESATQEIGRLKKTLAQMEFERRQKIEEHKDNTSVRLWPRRYSDSTYDLNRRQHKSDYPVRSIQPSLCPEEGEDFWSKDISRLLTDDVKLRDVIAGYFSKVAGASDGTSWEDLIKHLELKMNAEQLETSPPGDILLAILRVWNKKEVVTVRHFSDVCSELGITAIEQRLKMVKPNTKEVEQTSPIEETRGEPSSDEYNVF